MDIVILRNLLMRYGIDAGLNGSEQRLLWHLLDHDFNGKGYSFPGLKTIANRMGLKSKQGIIKIIESCERKAFLIVERNPGKLNRYHFDLLAQKFALYLEIESNKMSAKTGKLGLTGQKSTIKPQFTTPVNPSLPHRSTPVDPNSVSNSISNSDIYMPESTTESIPDLIKVIKKLSGLPATSKMFDQDIRKMIKKIEDETGETLTIQSVQESYPDGLDMWQRVAWDRGIELTGQSTPKKVVKQLKSPARQNQPKAKVQNKSEHHERTRRFFHEKLIPFDIEFHGKQTIYYNDEKHPKMFAVAWDNDWPEDEIIRRLGNYWKSKNKFYVENGFPLKLFVTNFNEFADDDSKNSLYDNDDRVITEGFV